VSSQSFEERAKKDPAYIRRRLEIHGGYDKNGDVFGIARPLPGPVLLPVKTFHDAKAREQFIDEFTFFRCAGRCPSWYSVLLASDCFSGDEKYSYTLKGKNYTPEGGKTYVTQLIASGELVVYYTGSWIPSGDRNHHLPWPKSSTKEEFLPVEQRPYTLGPHEEPGYVPPVNSHATFSIANDSKNMSMMQDEGVVPDNIRGGIGGNLPWVSVKPSSSIGNQEFPMSCGPACARQILQDRGLNFPEADVGTIACFNEDTGTSPEHLANALNKLDSNSTFVDGIPNTPTIKEAFDALNSTGPWIAVIKLGKGQNHFVIVDGIDNGLVKIRDPWGKNGPGSGLGLEGTVKVEDFMELWKMSKNTTVFRIPGQ